MCIISFLIHIYIQKTYIVFGISEKNMLNCILYLASIQPAQRIDVSRKTFFIDYPSFTLHNSPLSRTFPSAFFLLLSILRCSWWLSVEFPEEMVLILMQYTGIIQLSVSSNSNSLLLHWVSTLTKILKKNYFNFKSLPLFLH